MLVPDLFPVDLDSQSPAISIAIVGEVVPALASSSTTARTRIATLLSAASLDMIAVLVKVILASAARGSGHNEVSCGKYGRERNTI